MGLFYFKRSLGKLKLSFDHKSNNYVLFRKYLMFVKPISAEVIHFFGLSLLTFGTFAKRSKQGHYSQGTINFTYFVNYLDCGRFCMDPRKVVCLGT